MVPGLTHVNSCFFSWKYKHLGIPPMCTTSKPQSHNPHSSGLHDYSYCERYLMYYYGEYDVLVWESLRGVFLSVCTYVSGSILQFTSVVLSFPFWSSSVSIHTSAQTSRGETLGIFQIAYGRTCMCACVLVK